MTERRVRRYAGALLLCTATVSVAGASLNTAQIAAGAISQSCISWRVSGICYWLHCSWSGCRVRTSVKVSHFIPEAVVSTYTAPGGNPWREMALVSQASGGVENTISSGIAGLSAGGGNPADMKSPGQRKSAIRFKYAERWDIRSRCLSGAAFPGIRVSLLPHH